MAVGDGVGEGTAWLELVETAVAGRVGVADGRGVDVSVGKTAVGTAVGGAGVGKDWQLDNNSKTTINNSIFLFIISFHVFARMMVN